MTYKLFIDDERYPTDNTYLIARSSAEAIHVLNRYGIPESISFDHDLGGEDTSIEFIKYLCLVPQRNVL